MGNWYDIHDSSEKILKQILSSLEEKPEISNGKDEYSDSFIEQIESLEKRLEHQNKYDADIAYKKWRRYRLKKSIRWMGIAAGLSLIIGWSALWWSDQSGKETAQSVESISAGEKKATLTLADGKVWHIGDSATVIPTHQEEIRIDTNGIFIAKQHEIRKEVSESYHVLSIPRGGEFNMTLADGSKVWLNSESELSFPLKFTGEQRTVKLKGEAYFEVKKDAGHPFVVELEHSQIKVLGTEFNVCSYKDENQATATLVSGSIIFQSQENQAILEPGEQSILDSRGHLSTRQVDVYPFIAWKEGRFIFRKQQLKDIMATVSRWYNINVHFNDEESKVVSFSGGMMRKEGFETLVKMIETTGSVTCKIEGKNVFITKRKSQRN